jgi:hypothetical protein
VVAECRWRFLEWCNSPAPHAGLASLGGHLRRLARAGVATAGQVSRFPWFEYYVSQTNHAQNPLFQISALNHTRWQHCCDRCRPTRRRSRPEAIRTEERHCYRNCYRHRSLTTQAGDIDLLIPIDRRSFACHSCGPAASRPPFSSPVAGRIRPSTP